MHLFTYFNKNPERLEDYLYCLKKNSENKYIESINLLTTENLSHIDNKKIKLHKINSWPSYDDFLNIANIQHNEIAMISNGDIYFDDTINLLRIINNKLFVCLTRKELPGNPDKTNYYNMGYGAADVWVFKTPCKIMLGHTKIGTPYCDHLIAQGALKAGYELVNPCLDVNSWHKHKIRNKEWEEYSHQEYLYKHHAVKSMRQLKRRYHITIPFQVKFCSIDDMYSKIEKNILLL